MRKELKLPIILCIGRHPVIGEDGKPIVLEEKRITIYSSKYIVSNGDKNMKDKYSRIKEMINKSIVSGKTDNNSYYIGFIHGVEESGEDATELRALASKVPCLDHLSMGLPK